MSIIVLVIGLVLVLGVIFAVVLAVFSRVAQVGGRSQEYPDASVEAVPFLRAAVARCRSDARQQYAQFRELRADLQTVGSRRGFRIRTGTSSPSACESFLGKTQFVPLLRISYLSDSGSEDAMAWRVRDPSHAKRIIEEARAETAPMQVDAPAELR
jgi:hypothetical protein